jgi:hypothetical protein
VVQDVQRAQFPWAFFLLTIALSPSPGNRQERLKINMSGKRRFLWKKLWIICGDFLRGFPFLSLVIYRRFLI